MKKNHTLLKLILDIVDSKGSFLFWFFMRFFSALLPLYTVYLFGQAIRLLEQQASLHRLFSQILLILAVRVLDNYTRLISIHQLEHIIQSIEFTTHQFLSLNLKSKNKAKRHQTVQAIRNFGEAVRTTLFIIRQPGIDGLVSFFTIPIILFFLDFKVFVVVITYMATYYFIDIFTTERYSKLKNTLNAHSETYYGKFQETNSIATERRTYLNHLKKLCNWGFWEWTFLQDSAVFFYTLILGYLLYTVSLGQKQISDLVLIMGYIDRTQGFLNNLSGIRDRLADSKVALTRLANNGSVPDHLHLSNLS